MTVYWCIHIYSFAFCILPSSWWHAGQCLHHYTHFIHNKFKLKISPATLCSYSKENSMLFAGVNQMCRLLSHQEHVGVLVTFALSLVITGSQRYTESKPVGFLHAQKKKKDLEIIILPTSLTSSTLKGSLSSLSCLIIIQKVGRKTAQPFRASWDPTPLPPHAHN